jgi:hypothetical protein
MSNMSRRKGARVENDIAHAIQRRGIPIACAQRAPVICARPSPASPRSLAAPPSARRTAAIEA